MLQDSKKFWIAFVVVALIFLSGWFLYWEIRHRDWVGLRRFLGMAPLQEETKTDLDTLLSLADALEHTGGAEKTFLILFQNNLELRPGGGFIGSFAILKVRDGHITQFLVHDTGNFDGRIPDTLAPPYPMKETLKIPSWKLRDSNYAPDFGENAKQAVQFYEMGQGSEKFDGVVAITGNVLSSFLRVIGPIEIAGYPGTYGADNALLDLEYQVEQGYRNQDIKFGDRKSVMGILGLEILQRAKALPVTKQYQLFWVLLDDLHRKNIQLSFQDESLQKKVIAADWDGTFDGAWQGDFLALVDANLNSFKSDYFVKRSYHYSVDLTKETPEATLTVTYHHTATKKDWFTKDYQTFLRVYVPEGSYLKDVSNTALPPVYGEFHGKKYFGVLVQVPLGTEKTVIFHYTLPKTLNRTWYDLKVVKQPGLDDVPVALSIMHQDGTKEEKSFVFNQDTVLSELK